VRNIGVSPHLDSVKGADDATTNCGRLGSVNVDSNDSHTLLVTFNGQACNTQNVTITLTNVHDDHRARNNSGGQDCANKVRGIIPEAWKTQSECAG
jgi:hypothetical protein